MKSLFVLAFFLLVIQTAVFSQSYPYSRVRFNPTEQEMALIGSKGVALDHLYETENGLIGEFSKEETQIILGNCSNATVLIDDLTKDFIQNNSKISLNKRTGLKYTSPAGFKLGTMGSFFTLEEVDSHINALIAKYPLLISKKDSIGSSVEGRTIYSFKVSDNPNVDEDEAEVLYTAVHHAREPLSVMQMVYFLYYVCENYDKDPDIRYIVNRSEMYFVPFVNPDGYYYNQTTNPKGGGMWRKNRKENPDSSFGIDLNRNYGQIWGLNNQGSSPDTKSDVYRGPSAFSEPETQAIRNFCIKRKFYLALNYHTWGNHLIYPWGNDVGASTTPDSIAYKQHAALLVSENHYGPGTCMQRLYYTTNGCSDDWMYGEQTEKNKIFSFTPEVGLLGFWPPVDSIYPYCDENILQNINLAKMGIKMHPETPATSITDADAHEISISPNPSSGEIRVNSETTALIDFNIYDCTGRLVLSGTSSNNSMDLSLLNNGVYYCHIIMEGKSALNQKILILK
jgi:carboxypeptidase T